MRAPRPHLPFLFLSLLPVAALAGCLDDAAAGTLRVELASAEGGAAGWERLAVTPLQLLLHKETFGVELTPARATHDLVQLSRANATALVFEGETAAGDYAWLELRVAASGARADGATPRVAAPQGALRVDAAYGVPEGGRATFVLAVRAVEGADGWRLVADDGASGAR